MQDTKYRTLQSENSQKLNSKEVNILLAFHPGWKASYATLKKKTILWLPRNKLSLNIKNVLIWLTDILQDMQSLSPGNEERL